MIAVRGTLERIELGSGGWRLLADDGRRFELLVDARGSRGWREGEVLTIQGREVTRAGFLMTGDPQLEVVGAESAG